MERERIIKKIKILLETSSDAQIKMIENKLKYLIQSNEFNNLYEKQSTNYTTNGMQSMKEDLEEGNWGTLYRGV